MFEQQIRPDMQQDNDMDMEPITEEDELEAMIASYTGQQAAPTQRPPSPSVSEDEWDNIFEELSTNQSYYQDAQLDPSDQMDIS